MTVCTHKKQATLKRSCAVQISNKQDLTSAARQIWLAVHPDKNHASDAQAASQDFGKLLDSLKAKSLL